MVRQAGYGLSGLGWSRSVRSRRVLERFGRLGTARRVRSSQVTASPGQARQAWYVRLRLDRLRPVAAVMASFGGLRPGKSGSGRLVKSVQGSLGHGSTWQAWQALECRGSLCQGMSRFGRRAMERRVSLGHGRAWQAWSGVVCRVPSRYVRVGQAWIGWSSPVVASQVRSWQARYVLLGHVRARSGTAGHGRLIMFCQVSLGLVTAGNVIRGMDSLSD